MKLRLLFGGLMLACLPLLCSAQGKTKTTEHNGKVKTKQSPSWAAAHHYTADRDVYFPDYYTFYDPERGYIYWNSGKWTTSTTVPSYMSNVDMNSARIQIIDEDTHMRPEVKYKTYRETYPAQKVEVTVPIPDVR